MHSYKILADGESVKRIPASQPLNESQKRFELQQFAEDNFISIFGLKIKKVK